MEAVPVEEWAALPGFPGTLACMYQNTHDGVIQVNVLNTVEGSTLQSQGCT